MDIEFCKPHLERTGREVIATHRVNGEPFCESCFLGSMPGKRKRSDCRRKGVSAQQVGRLLCKGMTTAAMAAKLGVSTFTIRYHLKRLQRSKGAE